MCSSDLNPRTRVGCDNEIAKNIRGGIYFNPRTRVGCDKDKIFDIAFMNISIHAPAWGATAGPANFPVRQKISIHAPAWGATHRG